MNNGDPANKTAFNRLQRWGMWFDNFSFDIENIKGKENSLANFASRELNQSSKVNITQ
ncbi:hypothetical protein KI387_017801, partial [Taxus chinensis]